MEEEQNKEEGLEEILEEDSEELTEEELDEKLEEAFSKDDVLSEDEVKSKFTHMNTALVEGNVSTLESTAIAPITNLEEELKEEDEEGEVETQEIIEYGMDDEENLGAHYTKPEVSSSLYNPNKIRSRDNLEKIQSSSTISDEMAFVQKNMNPQYTKPEDLKMSKNKRDKSLLGNFRKLSDDYKTG